MNKTAQLLRNLGVDMQRAVELCDQIASADAENLVVSFARGELSVEQLELELGLAEKRNTERRLQIVQSYR